MRPMLLFNFIYVYTCLYDLDQRRVRAPCCPYLRHIIVCLDCMPYAHAARGVHMSAAVTCHVQQRTNLRLLHKVLLLLTRFRQRHSFQLRGLSIRTMLCNMCSAVSLTQAWVSSHSALHRHCTLCFASLTYCARCPSTDAQLSYLWNVKALHTRQYASLPNMV